MNVSVVILNWNAADDTVRCVRQLDSWRAVDVQIWVVDNASSDDSVERIVRECPRVTSVRNPQNEGFSGGTNRGIQAAMAASDAPILLLNNDASLSEETLLTLCATLEQIPSAGILGPLVYRSDNQKLITAGSRNPVWRMYNQILTVPNATKPYEVDYISGSVALIRAELFQKVGVLDEDYFFYTEIADLCRRARDAGYSTMVNPTVRAYHNLERSSDLRSTLYIYYIIRNRFVYIRKAYGLGGLPLTIFWGLYSALLAVKLRLQNNRATASAVWMGLGDGLSGRSGGQNERVLSACGRQTRTGMTGT